MYVDIKSNNKSSSLFNHKHTGERILLISMEQYLCDLHICAASINATARTKILSGYTQEQLASISDHSVISTSIHILMQKKEEAEIYSKIYRTM